MPRWEGEGAGGDTYCRRVTRELVNNVFQAMNSLAILPERVLPPTWIDPPTRSTEAWSPPFPAASVLVCRNGLIHLPGLVAGRPDCFHAPTPRFFVENALDYDFSLQAEKPSQWLAFLGKLWPDDPQAVELLQEWFGYCLTQTRANKRYSW